MRRRGSAGATAAEQTHACESAGSRVLVCGGSSSSSSSHLFGPLVRVGVCVARVGCRWPWWSDSCRPASCGSEAPPNDSASDDVEVDDSRTGRALCRTTTRVPVPLRWEWRVERIACDIDEGPTRRDDRRTDGDRRRARHCGRRRLMRRAVQRCACGDANCGEERRAMRRKQQVRGRSSSSRRWRRCASGTGCAALAQMPCRPAWLAACGGVSPSVSSSGSSDVVDPNSAGQSARLRARRSITETDRIG